MAIQTANAYIGRLEIGLTNIAGSFRKLELLEAAAHMLERKVPPHEVKRVNDYINKKVEEIKQLIGANAENVVSAAYRLR